jgi:hypothetical protein
MPPHTPSERRPEAYPYAGAMGFIQTTVEFLEIHRSQAATNRRILDQAEAKGQVRLADNLRQVQANLESIIPALEALAEEVTPDDEHD